MPLLDSFNVDHTKMLSPGVRLAKQMNTPNGDIISVYDLRFCKPNINILSECAIHTIEHLFANFMRIYLNSNEVQIIDISPMGCRTGFYMSLIGVLNENDIINAWINSMKDILKIKTKNEIFELNKYQCGNYKLHSLDEAKKVADEILKSKISINHNSELRFSKESLKKIQEHRKIIT